MARCRIRHDGPPGRSRIVRAPFGAASPRGPPNKQLQRTLTAMLQSASCLNSIRRDAESAKGRTATIPLCFRLGLPLDRWLGDHYGSPTLITITGPQPWEVHEAIGSLSLGLWLPVPILAEFSPSGGLDACSSSSARGGRRSTANHEQRLEPDAVRGPRNRR